MQVCVLLCTIVVLPLGRAIAQDFDAVERRLGQGVHEGELTLKQAAVMMDALRRAGGAKKDERPDRARAYLMKVRKELGAAVEAGKISREDAAKKFAGAEKAIRERMAAGRREGGANIEARLKAIGERLKAAVEAGKISEKEARAKWEEIKKGAEGRDKGDRGDDRGERARVEAHLRGAWTKLQGAVKAGKMSKEDADRKMGEIKRELLSKLKNKDGRKHDKDGGAKADAYLRAAWAKLQAAVKAGKMSEEVAHKKMGAIKREVFSKFRDKDGREHDKDARGDGHQWRGRTQKPVDNLQACYEDFVSSLNPQRFKEGYPALIKKLASEDGRERAIALRAIGQSGEIDAIPLLVPLVLNARDRHTRIDAGSALDKIVSSNELKRRDPQKPSDIVLLPRSDGDVDLRPLAWVLRKMLEKPDDGNTHAYAAVMIGYLDLKQFEPELRRLLKSRHGAVSGHAVYALRLMGFDVKQPIP